MNECMTYTVNDIALLLIIGGVVGVVMLTLMVYFIDRIL